MCEHAVIIHIYEDFNESLWLIAFISLNNRLKYTIQYGMKFSSLFFYNVGLIIGLMIMIYSFNSSHLGLVKEKFKWLLKC